MVPVGYQTENNEQWGTGTSQESNTRGKRETKDSYKPEVLSDKNLFYTDHLTGESEAETMMGQ